MPSGTALADSDNARTLLYNRQQRKRQRRCWGRIKAKGKNRLLCDNNMESDTVRSEGSVQGQPQKHTLGKVGGSF